MDTRQYQTSLDGIDKLRLAAATVEPPQGKQILVKIKAVSLNYKDAETIEGLFKHHKSSVAPADLVPCADSVGEVISLGTDVSKGRPGDRVLSTSYPNYLTGQVKPEYLSKGVGSGVNGVLTEYRLFDEGAVVRAPRYLTDVEACNMQIAGTTAWM